MQINEEDHLSKSRNKNGSPHFARGQKGVYALFVLPMVMLAIVGMVGLRTRGLTKLSGQKSAVRPAVSAGDGENKNFVLSSLDTYLPVGGVQKFEVPDPKGTAILIPQIHRNPGSEIDDPSNDAAQAAQKQIYDIEDSLNKKYGVDLIVVEGELKGKVSEEKPDKVAAEIKSRNDLTEQLGALKQELSQKDIDPAAKEEIVAELGKLIAKIDRAIALEGAPYELKAEGSNVDLYGAEIKATQDKSADIVRNYIYLNDRINSLDNNATLARSTGQAPRIFSANLIKLLQVLHSRQDNLDGDLSYLQNYAVSQNDSRLEGILSSIGTDIDRLKTADKADAALAASAPSRSDNPYNGITDKNLLESKLKQAEGEIGQVVVGQRNEEAVDCFMDALKDKGENVGIIQFGAGHEEGMVKDFNKRGISVIVITPQEVASSQTQ